MKLDQRSHCRLPYAADIGRNREYARTAAQKPYGNMAPADMAALLVDNGRFAIAYGINGKAVSLRNYCRIAAIYPPGDTWAISNSTNSQHTSTPATITARAT